MDAAEQGHRLSGAVTDLMDWVNRTDWDDTFFEWMDGFFARAAEDSGKDMESLFRDAGDFVRLQLFWASVETFLTCSWSDAENVVDAFLEADGSRLGELEKGYLRALRDSKLGLYEVAEVVPRSYVVVRDLIDPGEPIRVSEDKGSQTLVQWDVLAARVVAVDGKPVFSGILMRLSRTARDEILRGIEATTKAILKQAPKAVRKDPKILSLARESALEFLPEMVCYYWLFEQLAAAKSPTFTNGSGEDLKFVTLTYPNPGEDLCDRLVAAGDFFQQDEDGLFWIWNPNQDPQGSIYASLEFSDGGLAVSVNSLEREVAIRARLKELAEDLLGEPTREENSLEEMLAEAREPSEPSDEPEPTLEEQEEMSAAVREYLDRHYQSLLDEPVPALDNKTPRALAKTPKGRLKVVDWLKMLESRSADVRMQKEMREYDFTWMWKELGVLHLRR